MLKRYALWVFSLLASACNGLSGNRDKVRDTLPGIYVNQSAGNYSRAFDTLVITKEGIEGSSYAVVRRVCFQRIRHGVLQSREYHLEHWMAVYDDRTKVLIESRKGRLLTYVPEKKKLFLGVAAYLKIQ